MEPIDISRSSDSSLSKLSTSSKATPIEGAVPTVLSTTDKITLNKAILETCQNEFSKFQNVNDKDSFIETALSIKSKSNEFSKFTPAALKQEVSNLEAKNIPLKKELEELKSNHEKEKSLNQENESLENKAINDLSIKIGKNESQIASLNIKINSSEQKATVSLISLIHEAHESLEALKELNKNPDSNISFSDLHKLYNLTTSLASMLRFIPESHHQVEFNNEFLLLVNSFPEEAKKPPIKEAVVPQNAPSTPPQEVSGWGSSAWNAIAGMKNLAYTKMEGATDLASNATSFAASYIPDATTITHATSLIPLSMPSLSMPSFFTESQVVPKSLPPASKVVNLTANPAELIKKNSEAALTLIDYINGHESFFATEGVFRVAGDNDDVSLIQKNVLQTPTMDLQTLQTADAPLDAFALTDVLKRVIANAKLFSDPEQSKSIAEFAKELPRATAHIAGTSMIVAEAVSDEQIKKLKELISRLSDNQKTVLKAYFGVLNKVQQNSDTNLMTTPKLAPMVGPRLFEDPPGTVLTEMKDLSTNRNVLSQVIISHYQEIFGA